MRNLKKVLSVLLVVAMLATAMVPAFAASETSISADAKICADIGMLLGEGSDGVTPEYTATTLTRIQAAIMSLRLQGLAADAAKFDGKDNFADVEDDDWFAPYTAYLKAHPELGFIGDGKNFDAEEKISAQQYYKIVLTALGYVEGEGKDFLYADTIEFAAEKGLKKVDGENEELTVDDVAVATVEGLKATVKGGTKTLATTLVEAKKLDADKAEKAGIYTPVSPVALDVKSAVALNSKVVEVALNAAVTAVNASDVTVKDAAGAAVAVKDASVAPYSTDGKTVLVTLDKDTTSGTLYTLTANGKSVNFGGKAADTSKPTVKDVTANDCYEVVIEFNEAVKLDSVSVAIAEKYGNKAALNVTNMKYDGSKKIVLTTAEQSAVLYGITITNASDFAGNVMDKDDSKTFVGLAKPTEALIVKNAASNDPEEATIEFNINVDTTTIAPANFKVEEMYGNKATLEVTEARLAKKDEKPAAGTVNLTDKTRKMHVVITVPGLKDGTLYKVTVSNMKTLYGKDVSTTDSERSKTFVGTAKPSTELTRDGDPSATSNTTISVNFARKVDKATVENVANYAINEAYGDKAALTVTKAELQSNGKEVKLTVSSMKNVLYSLTLSNIKDIYGNALKTSSDHNKPTFVGVAVADKIKSVKISRQSDTVIRLEFDANVGASATDVSHYFINNSVGYPEKAALVTSSSIANKEKLVDLTIPETTEGTIYELKVTNLENSDGIAMGSDGVKSTFVGKGSARGVASIEGIATIDKNAFEIFFNKASDDSSISGFFWGSGVVGTSYATVEIKKGSGNYASLSTHTAYKDPANPNGLIVRYSNTSDIQSSTGEVVTLKVTSPYIKDCASGKEFSFASSNKDVDAPAVSGIVAENKYTLLVYFSQPMDDTTVKNANLSIVDSKTDASSAVNLSSSEVVKVNDTSFRVYVNDMTSNATAAADGKLYLKLTNLVKAKGGVSIKGDTSSDTNHYAMFGISTSALDKTDNVYAVMTDKRVVEVYYPLDVVKADALNAGTYGFVDSNGNTIAAPAIVGTKYDSAKFMATLYLADDMPAATNGNYVTISNTVRAYATGTAIIKDNVKKQFAVSSTSAAAPKIASATISNDRTKLTVTMEQPVFFRGYNNGVGDAISTFPSDKTLGLNKNVVPDGVDGSITVEQLLSALKINAVVYNATGVDTSGAKDLTTAEIASVTLKKNAKAIELTLKPDFTFKPGTSGIVSTDVATTSGNYTRLNTLTYVVQKTGSDKSEVTFGVAADNKFDTKAPTVVSAVYDSFKDDTITLKVTFNEKVTAGTVADYKIYYNGSTTALNAASAVVDSSADNKIIITFKPGVTVSTGDTVKVYLPASIKDANAIPLAAVEEVITLP